MNLLRVLFYKLKSRNIMYKNNDNLQQIKSALYGVVVGDALGVPVEFNTRAQIAQKPVSKMLEYGTHYQPKGTWSDDSSLTLCLGEALTQEFNLQVIGNNFVKWYHHNYWTARGEVFDIGIATREAIERLSKGERPDLAGNYEESSNGNGSLMRILPLLFYIKDKEVNERYQITKQVSSITHAHIRSVVACFYYLEFGKLILEGNNKYQTYKILQTSIPEFLKSLSINLNEVALFDRLLKENIFELSENEIQSSGYVVYTLEASIWCLLKTDNFKEAVLKAVNLGSDTDTTAAVTGGLAGLLYSYDNIPKEWLNDIARFNDIEDLALRMSKNY